MEFIRKCGTNETPIPNNINNISIILKYSDQHARTNNPINKNVSTVNVPPQHQSIL